MYIRIKLEDIGLLVYNTTWQIIQPPEGTPWVAVIVANERMQTFQFILESSEHVICTLIISEHENFYIINAYCQFSHLLQPFLDKIEKIIARLSDKRIIITMDANANSELWFSSTLDKLLEEFLISNNLYVLNEPNNPPTFSTIYGESNIDLMVVSGNMLSFQLDWRVLTTCTTSDHNLIIFCLNQQGTESRVQFKQNTYDRKRAN